MTLHDILGSIAVLIGLGAYIPYFKGIARGTVKPHVFTWLLWTILVSIGWAAQVSDNAGPGAWVTGATAIACFVITLCALKNGEKNITRSDWITFLVALSAIPLWLATNNALYAVILITVIDGLGYWPTLRKSWLKPYEESAITHFMSGVKFVFALAALHNVSWITTFHPASLIVFNFITTAFLLWRRRALRNTNG